MMRAMGGSTVERGYNAQRVVVEHKADGGKAMKDGAMKAMNNIPKYEGSGNEVMNDAPINKQHDDSKQDGCTRASKDEFSMAGVNSFKGVDEHPIVDMLSVNEMHYDMALLNVVPSHHLKGAPWHMVLFTIIPLHLKGVPQYSLSEGLLVTGSCVNLAVVVGAATGNPDAIALMGPDAMALMDLHP
jgi:hypothetical protein